MAYPGELRTVAIATAPSNRSCEANHSASGSRLPQLLVSVLLLGIADSMIGPYLVLFGADKAQLSPLQVGVFMSVIAVSGLAVSTHGRAGLAFRQQATPSSSLRLDDRASGAYSKVEDEACRRPTETNRLQGRGRSASAL